MVLVLQNVAVYKSLPLLLSFKRVTKWSSLKNQNITKIDENKDYIASLAIEPLGTMDTVQHLVTLFIVLLASLPGAAATSIIIDGYYMNLIQF